MYRILLCLLVGALAGPAAGAPRQVAVSFFSERLSVSYDPEMVIGAAPKPDEQGFRNFYSRLADRPYQLLLDDLLRHRGRMQLNDWLFYRLLRAALPAVMPDSQPMERDLTCWFLLTQAGFDTRLTWLGREVFLYVYSEDTVYEAPMIEDRGRVFVNLFSIRERPDPKQSLYLLSFAPNPGGRPFRFLLERLPDLSPLTETREISFMYQGDIFRFELETDRNIAALMDGYPLIAEDQYLQIPLSGTLSRSLLPKLRPLIAERPTAEALAILVSFTRSAFAYREDKAHFGHSKPMIPDEVFLHPYSDCEDRSALFFALVRELLDLPMIIVAFSDHLTVAVALTEEIGPAIKYAGRNYFICDPTGPVNSSAIGRFPKGYEKKRFQIIGHYK